MPPASAELRQDRGPGPGPAARVTVVGLGPGRPGLITGEALEAIAAVPVRWLRTSRHPSAAIVAGARSFDYLYDSATNLDEVYARIVDALVGSAAAEGHVLYAVPGSPAVAERTVELLRADQRVETTILAGVSFADLAFERLGTDPLSAGARLVDGHRFATEVAGYRGPLLVGQCDSPQVLSEVKLAIAAVVDEMPEPRRRGAGDRLAAPWSGRRARHHSGLGRPGPGGAARPPHERVAPAPSACRSRPNWCAWKNWSGPCGRDVPGTASKPTRA